MISYAALMDLQGPKTLAEHSFVKRPPDQSWIDTTLERFYDRVASDERADFVEVGEEPPEACVARVDRTSVVVVLGDQSGLDEHDLQGAKALQKAVSWLAGDGSVRAVRDDFSTLVRRHLARPVTFLVVTPDTVAGDNLPARAVLNLVGGIGRQTEEPFDVGPYRVTVIHRTYGNLGVFVGIENLTGCAFVSSPEVEFSEYDAVVVNARRMGRVATMVIPCSDDQLERARELEDLLGVELCDSVSESPTELVLSMMSTAMLTDMHPDLARRNWVIDERLKALDEAAEGAPRGGHQAFFVIDRLTGKPVFAYYYEERQSLIERVPNIVAAVASFAMGDRSAEKTSVVRTGQFNYVTIEHGNLVFTLVTAHRTGLEELRERFSTLPGLWDEEGLDIDNPVAPDPYDSIPFTLKLLSLLPPRDLLPRTVPVRAREPAWERFRNELVREFLKTLWASIDGEIDIGRLTQAAGLQLALGGIHLLHRLGAVKLRLRLRPEDVPILSGAVPPDVQAAYSELDDILREMNGTRTLAQIAESVNIGIDVLNTLVVQLYERGVIRIRFGDSAQKAS